jgi:hypothetical protein
MNGASVKPRGDLDAANQIQPSRARYRRGGIITGDRIVIGNGQRFQACCYRFVDELRRRICPVRFVGVRVKIDQKEISPSSSSLAHTRLALCSGLSLSECTTTSG